MMASISILSGCIQQTNDVATETGTVTVVFQIVGEEGEEISVETVEVDSGGNAFDAMLRAFGEDNIEYTDYGPGLGVMVNSIEDVSEREGYFWKLYVDGEESMVGISQISIGEHTTIRWEITKVEEY